MAEIAALDCLTWSTWVHLAYDTCLIRDEFVITYAIPRFKTVTASIAIQSVCSQSRYAKCLLNCESTEAALPGTTDSPGLGYTKSKFSRVPHDELDRLATNMSAQGKSSVLITKSDARHVLDGTGYEVKQASLFVPSTIICATNAGYGASAACILHLPMVGDPVVDFGKLWVSGNAQGGPRRLSGKASVLITKSDAKARVRLNGL
ncbi:hypothetical protein DM02DRAFT_636073 [Periconia macrospinosa]|uniref:Uncharacterized protein n=1 Tax=Periconia macrospinosa TaxID=97972 RepID=A0A2V1D201_9PLEO|nr:hypothetical protein DM02DRAFT_636073 [Periconia macrospinosa]